VITWRIRVGAAETTAILDPAESESQALFVCAHGAGSDMGHRSMIEISRLLRPRGFDVVRFNFLYRDRGSRRPDAMPLLKDCVRAVTQKAIEELQPRKLVLGGRSMGGRVATMLAAEGFACDGLVLFAYPLHPASKPEKLRAAHLPRIRVPVLCFNGTRDSLCRRDLMERAIAGLDWEMHWVEGASHGLATSAQHAEIAQRWLSRLDDRRTTPGMA
jgi:uncharacterized protein